MTKAKELAELASVTTVASGNVTFSGQVNGRDVAADGALAAAALPKGGGALTGAVTTNSTIDGRDVAADGVLATNALPKSGGALTGVLTTNSRIGVGTASPTKSLHVVDASDSTILVDAASGNQATVGFAEAGTFKFNLAHVASGDYFQIFNHYNDTVALSVKSNSNVGIGNTNPNLPLTLTCNSAANALALRARTNDDYSFMQFYNNAGSTLRGQISNYNGAMSFHTGNSAAQRLHISTAGYVTTASQTSFYATRTGNYTGYNASASGGSSLEVILYNGSTYNTGNCFDGGNGRFTAPVAGVYYFRAETYTGGTAFGQSWFVVNGSRAPGTDMVYGAATQIIGNSGILKLNANDWVGFHPYASNSNLTINAHVNHTWFRGHLLG